MNFTFFDDGCTLPVFKKQAKQLYKQGYYPRLSAAQNAISKQRYGMTYNRAIHLAKEKSPLWLNDALLLPIFHQEDKLFVIAKKQHIEITPEFAVQYPKGMQLDKPAFAMIEKTLHGWSITLNKTAQELTTIQITATDEGVVIDINVEQCIDNKHEDHELLNLDSTYTYSTNILSYKAKNLTVTFCYSWHCAK